MVDGFVSKEEGAVTVDWVVLTASLVGLGLAMMTVVSDGQRVMSENVRDVLRGDVIRTSFARSVTDGLSASAVLAVGEDFADLRNARSFSFRMEATLDSGDSGILFEAGGTVHGTILYQHEGVLYLQAGDGSGTGPAANRGEAVWTVRDGTYTIEASLDSQTGLALYVDGDLVSQSDFTHPRLAGTNPGMVGDSYASTPRNRGDFRSNSGDGHPGAGELTLFLDQTTGDEAGGD
jgi:hypothetical protein